MVESVLVLLLVAFPNTIRCSAEVGQGRRRRLERERRRNPWRFPEIRFADVKVDADVNVKLNVDGKIIIVLLDRDKIERMRTVESSVSVHTETLKTRREYIYIYVYISPNDTWYRGYTDNLGRRNSAVLYKLIFLFSTYFYLSLGRGRKFLSQRREFLPQEVDFFSFHPENPLENNYLLPFSR